MSLPTFVEPGWTLAVAASNRPDLRILFYPDGTRRFWHTCTVPPAPDVIAEHAAIQCSPSLQHDVRLWWDDGTIEGPAVTVTPSILCLRCQIHGFFTANLWLDA